MIIFVVTKLLAPQFFVSNVQTMRADVLFGLPYGELDRLSDLVVGVDSLPGSQSAEEAFLHGMCEAGQGAAQCSLATADYREKMWAMKSVQGLVGLLHLDQDSFAPKHANGQSYSGFNFTNIPEGISHAYSDRGPDGSLKRELIERSRALIQSYEAFCNGCVRSGLKGIR